jgi:hypothetical protein
LFVAAILARNGRLAAQPLSAQAETQASHEQPTASVRTTASPSGPGLIRFNGHALDQTGHPMQGVVGVTFAIYEDQSGGAPLLIRIALEESCLVCMLRATYSLPICGAC